MALLGDTKKPYKVYFCISCGKKLTYELCCPEEFCPRYGLKTHVYDWRWNTETEKDLRRVR